jgi:3-oxoacyl-[acyl-carrier-protein] synthase-3
MGFAYPEGKISNQFLESLGTGSTSAWISEKIGINTRRTSLPLDYIVETKNCDIHAAIDVCTDTPTSLGTAASLMACEKAGINPDQIGMVITNCCTPSQTTPGESQRIGKALGIKRAKAFDVFSACPAFALHVDFINNHKEETLPDYILCISTATLTQKVDYSDRTDGAIWGDGAAAYILSPSKAGKLAIHSASFTADPSRSDAVVIDTLGYFHQDGRAVRNFSVLQTVKMMRALEKNNAIDWRQDIFIGHQANYTMLQQITANRKVPDSNHWHNVIDVGNQAGAGAPASLAERWDDILPGQKIVVAVVGAGLSWGSLLLVGQ